MQAVEVKLSAFYFYAGEVKKAINSLGVISQSFGGSARLIVPTTILIQDNLGNFGLYSGLASEQYSANIMASYLGGSSVTHRGISTEEVIERKSGECSLILSRKVLGKIKAIVMSDGLKKEMIRKNAVVAYSLGDQTFLCANSQTFLELYVKLMEELQIEHNLFS